MDSIRKFIRIGSSSGYGSGSGSGSGYGDGSGSGSGYGDGYGDGLRSYNNHTIYIIDGVQTLIYSIKGYIAKGAIINKDLTKADCYIVRIGTSFAHGRTVKQAYRDAENKYLISSPISDRIDSFIKTFEGKGKINAKELFEWHYKLTGSCELGRKQFILNNNIDIDNDQYSIDEFIKITENSYGSEVINQLKNTLNKKASN